MSQAEHPDRQSPGHDVTVEDVRQLMGASTPHFALQLRNRIATLIARPARRSSRRACSASRRSAGSSSSRVDGEIRGGGAQDGQRPLALAARLSRPAPRRRRRRPTAPPATAR